MSLPGPELLGRLLNEHAAALALFARQWCSCPEDVVQEAFMRFAAERDAPANPAAWLFTVVRNGAISAGRAESRRRKHEAVAAAGIAPWFQTDERESIDAQIAANGLGKLALEQREVIVAHVWGGLTFAEIAEIVGSSTSAIHRRYQSGLQALRNLLGEKCLPTTDSTKHCRKS